MYTVNNKQKGDVKTVIRKDAYKLRSITPAPDWIIDIGANIGMYSVMARMLYPFSQIVALEPFPEAYQCLEINARCLYIFTDQSALTDGNPCVINKDFGACNTSNSIKTSKEGTIPGLSLKGLFDKYSIPRDCKYAIKLDCEGGEWYLVDDPVSEDVIRGALHCACEVHFKGSRSPDMPPWDIFDKWIHKFDSTHHVLYHQSNKNRGFGVYILTRR